MINKIKGETQNQTLIQKQNETKESSKIKNLTSFLQLIERKSSESSPKLKSMENVSREENNSQTVSRVELQVRDMIISQEFLKNSSQLKDQHIQDLQQEIENMKKERKNFVEGVLLTVERELSDSDS